MKRKIEPVKNRGLG